MAVQRNIKKGPLVGAWYSTTSVSLWATADVMIEAVTRVLQEKGTNDIFYDEF